GTPHMAECATRPPCRNPEFPPTVTTPGHVDSAVIWGVFGQSADSSLRRCFLKSGGRTSRALSSLTMPTKGMPAKCLGDSGLTVKDGTSPISSVAPARSPELPDFGQI